MSYVSHGDLQLRHCPVQIVEELVDELGHHIAAIGLVALIELPEQRGEDLRGLVVALFGLGVLREALALLNGRCVCE